MTNIRDAVERWARIYSPELETVVEESSDVIETPAAQEYPQVIDDTEVIDDITMVDESDAVNSDSVPVVLPPFCNAPAVADNSNLTEDKGYTILGETRIATSCELNADKCNLGKYILFPPLRNLQPYCRKRQAFCYPALSSYERANAPKKVG